MKNKSLNIKFNQAYKGLGGRTIVEMKLIIRKDN